MKKLNFAFLFIILGLLSCNNSDKKDALLEKEKELLQKELNLTKKELKLKENITAEYKKIEEKQNLIELESAVRRNLIHCENKKFIIKIDQLKNDDLRYISWNKPKSTSEKPDLIIYNGITERQGTGGGYHYIFKNGEWKYIIENSFMGETIESMGVFLKLVKSGEQKLYTKMIDLKN